MKQTILACVAVTAVLFGAGALAAANVHTVPLSAATGKEKVGVCHRTASETNPYVFISVPADEANGHITGTSKQHNHKVTWPTAGTWRGVLHAAGDERLDYYAQTADECEDTVVTTEPTTPVETTPTETEPTETEPTETTTTTSEPPTTSSTTEPTPPTTTGSTSLPPPTSSTITPPNKPQPPTHAQRSQLPPVPTAYAAGV